ncbi:hypothetical protein M3Y94_00687700 [Aphelenchoides besseyi]|nr:hypothetical protein M3Y94_00687700 [Aphelenchoides besseyi]KAI6231494.1 hypothetical protein M3Y95_00387700 [Aphelenchoides besseyi]
MIRLMFVIVIAGLLARMAMAQCGVRDDDKIIDLDKCSSAYVQLRVLTDSFHFKIEYKQEGPKALTRTPGFLLIGGCELKFELVIQQPNDNPTLIFGGVTRVFYFPIFVTINNNGIVIGTGTNAKTLPCAYKKTNNIVEFRFKTESNLGLRIQFEDAIINNRDSELVHENTPGLTWAAIAVILSVLCCSSSVAGSLCSTFIWFLLKKRSSDMTVQPTVPMQPTNQIH